ncbi:formate dehydrogenase accessory sulfurtransferase FdhD [Calidifontibacter terrae]
MRQRVVRRKVTRITVGQDPQVREDKLAAEEPLEIRLNGRPFVVTMRTPGHDIELAAGFLVGEGLIRTRDDIATGRYCAGSTEDGVNTYNVLDLQLAQGVPIPGPGLQRNVYTSSSCGVCGKASIDAVRTSSPYDLTADALRVPAERLSALPEALRGAQRVFAQTGGLHAAGLFDGGTGELLVAREDVGRHNAVDKVIGWALENGHLPLTGRLLMVSGRASFELVQKASLAGLPLLAAVSAPSSLAAELAEDSGLTLVGFLRGDSMVVYTRADRVTG